MTCRNTRQNDMYQIVALTEGEEKIEQRRVNMSSFQMTHTSHEALMSS